MKAVLYSVFTIFLCGQCFAQTIQTDRPNQTEASSTVPAKSLQIETGIGFNTMATTSAYQGIHYNGLNRQFIAPTSVFRIGLTKQIEFRVVSQIELNSNFNPRVSKSPYKSSFSNVQMGAKVQLYKKEDAKTEALILGHVTIPKGNTPNSQRSTDYFGKLCVSHQLSDNFNIGYNIGYRSVGNLSYIDYSCAFSFGITDKLSAFAEQYGQLNQSNIAVVRSLDNTFSYDLGLTYLLNNRLQLDWAFGSGMNVDMNFITIGCSALIMK